MNAKLLFAATVAVSALSLASTVAMAADATGGVARGQLDSSYPPRSTAPSPIHRSDVIAELAAERTAHPYDNVGQRYGQSNDTGYSRSSTLARAEVKADVRHAMADGTLMRNGEGDNDTYAANATQSRAAHQHLAYAGR